MHRRLFLILNLILWLDIQLFIKIAGSGVNVFEKALLLVTGLAIIANRPIIVGNVVVLGIVCVTLVFMALGVESRSFSWLFFVSGFASLISVFSLLLGELTEEDALYFLKVLACGAVAVVGIGVLYQLAGVWQVFQRDASNGAMRLAGSTIPAFLGAYAYVSSFASAVLFDRLRQKRYLALAAVSLLILILTGARMPLAVTMPLCGLVFLQSKQLSLVAKLLAGFYSLVALVVVFATIGQSTLARFAGNSLSGREKLWNVMLNIADAHPIFGVGLGHQQLYFSRFITATTGTIAAHNEYFRLSMEIGYVGAALFFILFIAFFINMALLRQVVRKALFLTAVLSFLIYASTDNVFGNSMIFILLAGYCAAILKPPAEVPRTVATAPGQRTVLVGA